MPPRAATSSSTRSLSGNEAATLFAVLDSTVTAMGSRALRRWLNRPTARRSRCCASAITRSATLAESRRYEPLRERAARDRRSRAHPGARRAALGTAARPGAAARLARRDLPACARRSAAFDSPLLRALQRANRRARAPSARCSNAPSRPSRRTCCATAASSPPATMPRSMSCARSPATPTSFLLELERRERERTGIANLKLGYNRVHQGAPEPAEPKAVDVSAPEQIAAACREIGGAGDAGLSISPELLIPQLASYLAPWPAVTVVGPGLRRRSDSSDCFGGCSYDSIATRSKDVHEPRCRCHA